MTFKLSRCLLTNIYARCPRCKVLLNSRVFWEILFSTKNDTDLLLKWPTWMKYLYTFVFPSFSGLMSVITNWKPYRADGVLEEERATCQIVEDGRLHLLFLDNGVNSWLFVCIFYLLIIGLRMNGFFKTSSIRESVIFMCWFLILCACISVSGKKQKNQKTVSPSSNQTEVIQRLSNFFGIDRIPGRIFRKPPPDYMIDLYNSITDSGGLMKRESPYKADVIRSFPDRRE